MSDVTSVSRVRGGSNSLSTMRSGDDLVVFTFFLSEAQPREVSNARDSFFCKLHWINRWEEPSTTALRPDPTFYPSPRTAMQAPPEKLAYMVILNPDGNGRPDALAVLDVDPDSSTYSDVVARLDMPNTGDELHHFGSNACSAALCPYAPHPHIERRYLVVPGARSSRIHVIDTKPDPRQPKIVKVIEPDELHQRTGYSRPHTVHCGPEGIYLSALGAPDGEGPGGVLVMDHETFEPLGRWEVDRGPQRLTGRG